MYRPTYIMPVMYVCLEAENLLPRPRLDVLNASPRDYCLASVSSLLPRLDLMLRHRRSEPLSYVIYVMSRDHN